MKIRRFPLGLVLFTMALAIGLTMQIALLAPTARRVAYSEVVAEAQLGHLAEVEMGAKEVRALLTEAAANEKGIRWITATRLPGIDEGAFVSDLQARGVRVSGRIEGSAWAAGAVWIMPVALVALLYFWSRRGAEPARGALTFAKWDPLESTCRHASLSIL